MNSFKSWLLLLLLHLLVSIAKAGEDHPLTGKIVDVASGEFISEAQLLTALSQQRAVFIGEKHDNPRHHTIEKSLLHALVDSDTAVVFEMLDDSMSANIPDQGESLSNEVLRQRLRWDEKQWPWQDYGVLFEEVLTRGGRLVAGNLARQKLMEIYRDGLSTLEKPEFKSAKQLYPDLSPQMTVMVREAHCGAIPSDKLQPMVIIQLSRDAAMARAMQGREQHQLLISGAMHARKDIGVPRHWQMAQADPYKTLLLVEVNLDKNSWLNYEQSDHKIADYVWFTPEVSVDDYCDAFKKQEK